MAHDRETLDKLAAWTGRVAELETMQQPPISPEQLERGRFQYESNLYAEQTPLYAAARAAAGHRAILPLEPLGTKPLVPVRDATSDTQTILDWWAQWPTANPGVVTGRSHNLIAMRIEDSKAATRLLRLARVEQYDPDTDSTTVEFRPFEAVSLRFVRVSGATFRSAIGWGRDYNRKINELTKDSLPPEECWWLWSYPHVGSGMDAHEFAPRRVATGVDLLGPGAVIPWAGSVFEGNLRLVGPGGPLPVIPTWIAQTVGKPRSRKAMRAAREAYDAMERAVSGISDAEVLQLVDARARAQADAAAEVKRARAALAKAEGEESYDELPPVVTEEEAPTTTGTWG
jgi:Bifunctional DNA primase/polymerase, N-terminal